jgi:hypothetical protein
VSLFLLLLLLCTGCASRSLTIESDPPGALVILNRHEVGTTPVTVPCRYGGPHEIILIPPHVGRGEQAFEPAFVAIDTWRFELDMPFVDGVAELLGTEDHPTVHVVLKPSDVSALGANPRTRKDLVRTLEERADTLRRRTREAFIDAPPRMPIEEPREDK